MSLAIGIDIGGTKVAAGVVDADGKLLATSRRPTPSNDPARLAELVAEVVTELRAGYDVAAVGVGAAGWVDASRTTVLFAPNLAWRNTPLHADLSRLLDLPVDIENDANAAAWGEFRFGAGEREPDTVVLTIGTGIGAGFIIDGELRRGRFGIGGEPGHLRVVPGGRPCGCGNHGCLEQYCSGRALVRAAREIARERPQDARRLLELAGGDPDAIDGPTVTVAAQEGDHAAVDCFEEIGRWLGQGLADLATILDPGRFVIGGGVADAGELLLRPARETYAAVVSGHGYRPLADVVPARLGSDAGLIGAADLARTLAFS
ncbi:MAG TPA: ROK family glucokinase [Mycobacteriales bacterium]|nr:ROK family glucokinase [Mycobacteriales bacterium]